MNLTKSLILLGAGATKAVSNGRLPTSDDFFSSNSIWRDNRSNYPHLSLACQKLAELKTAFSPLDPVTLTDVWLLIDTLFKYHKTVFSNSEYDNRLLRNRLTLPGIPEYLKIEFLNNNFLSLAEGMRPLFSTMPKEIYDVLPKKDPVGYFLLIAGWELKHLLFVTYSPSEVTNTLYNDLLSKLSHIRDLGVISFNYDIYFEKQSKGIRELELAWEGKNLGINKTTFCKPHGGWNIPHCDDTINPVKSLTQSIDASEFDRTLKKEVRPAMIPYFASPDEISIEHKVVYNGVGKYFSGQRKTMNQMFKDAERIVSIGYSFSKSDLHVRKLIEELPNRSEKRILLISRENPPEEVKTKLFKTRHFSSYDGGFNQIAIDSIYEFLRS